MQKGDMYVQKKHLYNISIAAPFKYLTFPRAPLTALPLDELTKYYSPLQVVLYIIILLTAFGGDAKTAGIAKPIRTNNFRLEFIIIIIIIIVVVTPTRHNYRVRARFASERTDGERRPAQRSAFGSHFPVQLYGRRATCATSGAEPSRFYRENSRHATITPCHCCRR